MTEPEKTTKPIAIKPIAIKLGGWGVAGVCVASPFVAVAGAIVMVTFVAFGLAILATMIGTSPLWGGAIWLMLRDDKSLEKKLAKLQRERQEREDAQAP